MSSYQIRFYALPEIHDIRMVHGHNVTHRFPRHIHDSVVFGIIVRGQRAMDIRGETIIISQGECFALGRASRRCGGGADALRVACR